MNDIKTIKRRRKCVDPFDVVNGIIMVVLGLTFVLPFWMLITASLSDNSLLTAQGISLWFRGFSVDGYKFIFQVSDLFVRSIFNSVIVSFGNAALSVILCTAAAYVLAKKDVPFRKFLNGYFMIPMFFGGGLIPLYLVIRGINIYDTVWALILPSCVRISNVLLLRNYFYGIPSSLYEASELDGANQFQILVKVFVPLAVPMMLTVGMIMFVDRWNNWLDTLMYFGATNRNWWTIQYVLRQILVDMQALYGGSGAGSIIGAPLATARNAAIVVAVVPLIALSPVLHKYYMKCMTAGAVKG